MRALFAAAAGCRYCPRVVPGSAVLSDENGPPRADWLFVGEAPGRLGAGRTGVPFSGDESGRRFGLLLAEAALCREEIFITNALLCLPIDERGRNRTPVASELAACRPFLARTIEVVDPLVVVTLGAVALRALAAVHPHALSLQDAPHPVAWEGRLLVPLYHPGRRAEVHRPWEIQAADWRGLRAIARSLPRERPRA